MQWTIADGYTLDDLLSALSEGRVVYALEAQHDGQYRYVQADVWAPGRHTLGAYRPVEPVKSLLFAARERVGAWGQRPRAGALPERIVFGVKSCDLSSLTIQDHVFLNGAFTDPHYAQAREKTVVVSSDCTGFRDTCFCPVVGERPYSTQGFDINVSTTPNGNVLEVGSERGTRLLENVQHLLKPAGDALLGARESQRAAVHRALVDHTEDVCGLVPDSDLRSAVEGAFDSGLWQEFAADCVECGACNFICCTCHCFLLGDGLDESGCPARNKQWDACLFANFARTAGGANPRPRRAERLRNRFDKKFVYFPHVLGEYACDGCGRCTEACIGKIDIRSVLKRAIDDSVALHADAGDD